MLRVGGRLRGFATCKESTQIIEEITLALESTASGVEAPHFSTMLQRFAAEQPEGRIAVGSIIRAMEHRSTGALLLICALPMVIPIPAPGVSVPFGIFLMLVSAELMFARGRIWLPPRLAARSISREDFLRFVSHAVPALRRIEHFTQPRMTWLTGSWGIGVVGAICLLLATIIALPIPMGHFLPGVVICVLAIGLMESDGLLIAAGFLAAVFVLGIVTWASAVFVSALNALFNGQTFH
jgi:hypothetical protein